MRDAYNLWDPLKYRFTGSQGQDGERLRDSGERLRIRGGFGGPEPEAQQERAANVVEFLEQQGGIPLTNMLAPGAMGTSKQVAPDNTSEGQAENRRVVVRVLQNKRIAGS